MKVLLITIMVLAFFYSSICAQDGEVVFKNNCAVCHQFGRKLIGPDLTGVFERRPEEWVRQFVKSSQEMIKNGDPDAVAVFDEFGKIAMPDHKHLSDQDLEMLFQYIATQVTTENASTAGAYQNDISISPVMETSYTETQINRGRELFTGNIRLGEKGPACMSCHSVADSEMIPGGQLAKELSDVYKRMGDAGVRAIIGNPPFPAMAVSYKDHQISTDEARDLSAYLQFVSLSNGRGATIVSAWVIFAVGGGVGSFFMLLAIALVWKKRKNFSVKEDIFSRQIKTV